MTSRVDHILKELGAFCAQYPHQNLAPVLRQLLAHWTRKQNLITKGKPSTFTPFEIDEIIEFLERKLRESHNV